MKFLKSLLCILVAFTFVGFIWGCTQADKSVEIGIDEFEQVHLLLKDHVEEELIAGASALVLQDGEVSYRDHVGWMDFRNEIPMSDSTLFRIASMTKAVTSAAVMLLYEEGQLSLSDPVSEYIPAFSNPVVVVGWDTSSSGTVTPKTISAKREITIHDLLSHTSGLSYNFMSGENFASLYQQAGVTDGLTQIDITLDQNIERLAELPLMYQPGTRWHYSLSHDVLGRVIEIVSGESLDKFFQEHIFRPLDMNNTHFFISRDKVDRLATLYTIDSEQKITPTGEEPIRAGNLVYSSDFHYQGPKKYYSGGAGLVSTINDYGRFLQMLLNGGELEGTHLLKPGSVKTMTQNQIETLTISPFTGHGDKFGYGFGVLTEAGKTNDVASVGTYSWGGIFNTYYWVDPQEQIVGIIMTQLFPYDHLTLRNDFKETVYEVIRD